MLGGASAEVNTGKVNHFMGTAKCCLCRPATAPSIMQLHLYVLLKLYVDQGEVTRSRLAGKKSFNNRAVDRTRTSIKTLDPARGHESLTSVKSQSAYSDHYHTCGAGCEVTQDFSKAQGPGRLNDDTTRASFSKCHLRITQPPRTVHCQRHAAWRIMRRGW